jgi:hypothetical protein
MEPTNLPQSLALEGAISAIIQGWEHNSVTPLRRNAHAEVTVPGSNEKLYWLWSDFALSCNGKSPEVSRIPHITFVTTCLSSNSLKESFNEDKLRLQQLLKDYDAIVSDAIQRKMDECVEKYGEQAFFF